MIPSKAPSFLMAVYGFDSEVLLDFCKKGQYICTTNENFGRIVKRIDLTPQDFPDKLPMPAVK